MHLWLCTWSLHLCLYYKYRSYGNFNDFVKSALLGALVSLAPLAKPMVIESEYMSLSQIQKELLPI